MTKQTLTVMALSVIAIALSGCGASGSKGATAVKPAEKITPAVITEGQEKDLFPCKVGNTWTYDGTTTASTPGGNRSSNMEVTFKIVDVVDGPEGTDITMHVLSDGTVTQRPLPSRRSNLNRRLLSFRSLQRRAQPAILKTQGFGPEPLPVPSHRTYLLMESKKWIRLLVG